MACTKSNHAAVHQQKPTVRFNKVRIHTHEVRLGDNPSVSSGPPITLDWDPRDSVCLDLDEFERLYGHDVKKALRVSARTRELWIRNIGHSTDSIRAALAEVEHIKESRRASRKEATEDMMKRESIILNAEEVHEHPTKTQTMQDAAPKQPRRRISPPNLCKYTTMFNKSPTIPRRRISREDGDALVAGKEFCNKESSVMQLGRRQFFQRSKTGSRGKLCSNFGRNTC